ncbi:sensor histidine kinase [Desertihabitans aurantiacus]|uniref:sensor histidine kinase n=1 Tax=Desertihabitans aurantiacus TaxID=2282477 RepID=UPI000DF84A63|nr:HAMP domain-containing sensor histidine kinase [Desertihabitans aurantiacus]
MRAPALRRSAVRTRIMAAVLLTTLLGMSVAGVVSYVLARQATFDTVREALVQESDEIRTIAELVAEGGAEEPMSSPRDVLYLAISRSVPNPNEAILGLVDGAVEMVPQSGDPFQQSLAADTELVQAAAAVRPGAELEIRYLSTEQHRSVAYLSIPVQVEGSSSLGHYVAVVDVEAAMAPINRTHLTYAGICVLTLLVVAAVGYVVAGRLLAPLRSLQTTAQRISEADLTDRIPAEQLAAGDEVSDLGLTVNAMLDRLSDSFDQQRRMLDDAGHELRTPLTIVRGHLELVDAADPADVSRTRDLAMDELDRMHRMVEELMMLARSKLPDFTAVRPTVVADLLDDVLAKSTALGDRLWRIEQTVVDTVLLDPQRITQALLQLVSNAVRFTGPGDLIALGADCAAGELRIWVRDTGSGIAADEQGRIFERFYQGGPADAGAREAGAGLGLAIVSAIAAGHGGTVRLRSAPGVGSTFTLVLPAVPDEVSAPLLERTPSKEVR